MRQRAHSLTRHNREHRQIVAERVADRVGRYFDTMQRGGHLAEIGHAIHEVNRNEVPWPAHLVGIGVEGQEPLERRGNLLQLGLAVPGTAGQQEARRCCELEVAGQRCALQPFGGGG